MIIFAIAVFVFLVTPVLMTKMRIPGIIGPIIAGVILGPYGLHILERDSTIELLGTVGLLFIIFIAGLELDIDGFKKYKNKSIIFGLLSFFIPLIFGTLVGLYFEFNWAASLLLGSILGSHTLLAYPIASKLGVTKNKAVITAIGGTLLTDTLAMVFLAVIAGVATGDVNMQFWLSLIVSSLVFIAIIMFGVPLLSKWFFKNSNNDGAIEFNYVMVVLFTAGCLALFAGLQPIIGAFLAGLALNRHIFEHGALMNRINFTANALFIPFFLLSVGMLMDLKVLVSSPDAWILTLLILVSVVTGKYLASWLASKLFHFDKTEKNLIFGLSIPQAAATLAATLVGYELKLLNQQTVNAIIVIILISCVIGPYVTEKNARKLAMRGEQDTDPIDDKKPERILIPIANPSTMESLLDLSFLIRRVKDSNEPIYPLTVVRKHVKDAETDVASAEKMLGHALFYASGAEIPIRVLTRVDSNIGKGIERAVTEERITTIITGWNADKSISQKVFGGVIDNVLDHTYNRALIVRQTQTIQTTEKIIVILPKGIITKPGFKDSIRIVKGMVKQLNCTIQFVVMHDELSIYEAYIKEIKPQVTAKFVQMHDWKALEEFYTKLGKTDLIIAISARKGTLAWHPNLEKLPMKLAKNNDQNFIIFYPFENKEVDLRGSRGTALPKEVLTKRDYN